MAAAVYAYPWNFHALDADVARIKSLGADEVTLAVSYHAGKFIQPGDAKARVYFPEDGTIYFRPRRTYGAVKPQVSVLTQSHDVLADLCDRGNIGVNAWVVLNHNTRLGMTHLELTVRNAFGDAYPYSLCPANPEVRDYAVTLCADIAEGYAVKTLLLESPGYLTYAHGFHHEFAQVAPEPWLDALLGLCFCQRCCDAAVAEGVDASGLAARTRGAIDAFLAGDLIAPSLAEWEASDADLVAYHQLRCDRVTGLVADIRANVAPSQKVKVIATCQRPHATAYLEGHDLWALDAASDGLELPLYQPNAAAVLSEARYVLARTKPERTSVILRPGYPDLMTDLDLRQAVAGLEALGIEGLAFYNLGMLRPADLRRLQNVIGQQVAHV